MKKTNFTLTELLVVITILGILMVALFPGLNAALIAADQQACRGNLSGVKNAVATWRANNQGKDVKTTTSDGATDQAIRYAKLIESGDIENSRTLRCKACQLEGNDEAREATYTQNSFRTSTDPTNSKFKYEQNFRYACDYSLVNKKIPSVLANSAAHAADGYRPGAEGTVDGHNHENYGSVLYTGGAIEGLKRRGWFTECAGQRWNSDMDTGLKLY